jgi:hypothetical protein
MLLVSCLEEPECFNLTNDMIGFTYKVMGSGATDNLAFTGIHFMANGEDSVINENFNGSTFSVPLDFLHDQMALTFTGLSDTVLLGYTVKSQFVSEDCGPRFVLSDLNIVDHTFDSMRVVAPVPGNSAAAKNIEIYRCPITNYTNLKFFQLYSKTKVSEPLSFTFTGVYSDLDPTPQNPNGPINSVTFPLNLEAPATTFFFSDGVTNDTLRLDYTLTTEVRYRPCGTQTFISDMKVESFTFDSASIARDVNRRFQNAATDPVTTNVNIYKCPVTNFVQMAFRKPAPDGSANTVANPVSLTGIQTDYSADIFYQNASSVSVVALPLNPASDTTVFYFDYPDKKETISVIYKRQDHTVFRACGSQVVFSQLKEAVDLPNVKVLETDSVTFPVVTNFEILP